MDFLILYAMLGVLPFAACVIMLLEAIVDYEGSDDDREEVLAPIKWMGWVFIWPVTLLVFAWRGIRRVHNVMHEVIVGKKD